MPSTEKTSSPPKVTVVVATYNRSAVLAYALRSLCAQTFTDWECLVIGDACTDDTAEVVASIDDPRIRFENLTANAGDQSGPNNYGCAHARGRFIAFLNHDDLWLPGHLANGLAALERSGADLVFALTELVLAEGRRELSGLHPNLRYDPHGFVVASSWVFRADLLARVGPWRRGMDCWVAPSQDWLFRAHRAGARLVCVPALSVIAIPSSIQKNSYRETGAKLHAEWWARISSEPQFMATECASMTAFALDPRNRLTRTLHSRLEAAQNLGDGILVVAKWAALKMIAFAQSIAPWFGVHPHAPLMAVRHGWRGGMMRYLRGIRGLDTPNAPKQT